MKIVQRGTMKILPGKMAEAMELNQKLMAIASRYGMPTTAARMYRPFTGGGDTIHTIVFEIEWDSLTTAGAAMEKIWTDPEVVAQMPKWEEVLESHHVELYMLM